MRTGITKLWNQILKNGYDSSLDDGGRKSLIMINSLSAVTMIIVILTLPFFAISGDGNWYMVFFTLPVYLVSLLFNHEKQYSLGRYTFFIGCFVLATLFSFANRRTGTEYSLVGLAVMSGLIFFRKGEIIVFFLLSVCSLLAYEAYDYATPFVADGRVNYLLIKCLNILLICAVIGFEISLFHDVRKHYIEKHTARHDLTQRALREKNEAENRLKESNFQLQTLNDQLDWIVKQKNQELQTYLDAINIHIYSAVTDTHGKIIRINTPFLSASNYEGREVIGKNLMILSTEIYPDIYFGAIRQKVLNGETWREEMRGKGKDGTGFWMDMVIIPIKDIGGKVDYFLLLGLPITERKLVEAERERTSRMLEIIAFQTSHRMRRPITSILGLANLINKNLILPEELADVSDKFNTCAMELDEATRDLTTYVNNHGG